MTGRAASSVFHGKRHPQDMGAAEVEAFLSHLAVERQVSASTQNQAKAVILYLLIQAGFRDRTGVAGRGGAGQAAAAFAGGAHADRGP